LSLSSEQKDQVKSFLKSLAGNQDYLQSLLLANSDGRLLAFSNYSKLEFEKAQLAAMAASLSGLNVTVARACGKQSVHGGVIETGEGLVLTSLLLAGEQEFVLLGIFADGCQHGMAMWNFRKYQQAFAEIVS
jgi:predicted regulator of Ras-like GTPase activity (Roadblock/LC7/MglB family)